MKTSRYTVIATALMASVSFGAMAAKAQPNVAMAPDNAAQTDSPALPEMVVTARRSQEREQSVPIAITAFTQKDLEQRQINTATDLQNFTPSLTVSGSLSRNDESLTLRGIGATNSTVGGGPGVVAYLSEVPYSASGPGLFFDLQNLEVLKGPQGTLFGRNTTGGAVLLEPVRPNLTTSNGYATVTGGSYNHVIGEGAASVPLIGGQLAFRVAGRLEWQDGTTYDVALKRRLDNRHNSAVRAGLTWQPTDKINSYTLVQYVDVNERAGGSVLALVNPAGPFAALVLPLYAQQQARGPRSTALSVLPNQLSKTLIALNNTQADLGDHLRLKNIFSYTRREQNNAVDGDGTTLQINDLKGADPGTYSANNRTITEEGQVQLHDVGMLSAVAGAYYEDTADISPRTFNQVSGNGAFGTHQNDAHYTTHSVGVFGQGTLDLSHGVKLTGGYRQTWDRFTSQIAISLAGTPICLTGGGPAPNCPLTKELSGTTNGPSWTINVNWQADRNTLLYATGSRGYKSGGFNDAVGGLVGTSDPLFGYKPEDVLAVEFGLKRDWRFGSDVRVRTNLSVFENRYENIQRSDNALIGTPPRQFNVTVTTNAAQARIQGVEFEGVLQPTPWLTLNLAYSYLDTKYTKYIDTRGADQSGLPFQYAPRDKLTFETVLKLPAPESLARASVRASYSYQGREQVAPDREPLGSIDPYGLVNLRLNLDRVGGSNIDFAVFATNVTNRLYAVASNPNYYSTGLVTRVYGDPRMIGISLGVRF